MSKKILEYAKEILTLEANAILQIIPLLDENFLKAVDWILQCQGRIIVTGMGKSGIIAEKISATMASTGTPSLSLNPAEAIHGDLGRVVKNDLVIALSKAGETEEILKLLPLLKRIGVKIIAVSANINSTLGKYSDLALSIGKVSEACPIGMAPTTSTTAMLALGDCLAMCVAKERNFTREEYALFHPGGSLGRQLMKVEEIMRVGANNPILAQNTSVMDVLMLITRARAGAASIVDGTGKLCGIFTDGDLRRHIREGADLKELTIDKIMTKNPITVFADTLVVEATRILKEKKIDELPVVSKEFFPIGMLDIQDILDIGNY